MSWAWSMQETHMGGASRGHRTGGQDQLRIEIPHLFSNVESAGEFARGTCGNKCPIRG
jgi:hypothetical protein